MGPPIFSKSTKLDGRLLRITETLHSALRGLRKGPSEKSNAILWADAVCINQSNVSEKNSQFGRLAAIVVIPLAKSILLWSYQETAVLLCSDVIFPAPTCAFIRIIVQHFIAVSLEI